MLRANRSNNQLMKSVDTKHIYDNGDSLGRPEEAELSMDAINMKKMDKIKAIITVITGALSSALGILFVPVILLVLCNIIDYATGLLATPSRKENLSSYKSIRGITKK